MESPGSPECGSWEHGHGLFAPRRRADAVFSHLAGQAMKWAPKGMVVSRWEGQLHLREQVEQAWIAQASQVSQERSKGGVGMGVPVIGDCHGGG